MSEMPIQQEEIAPTPKPRRARLTGSMLLLGALSLSIGWGIRGNFGHEYGAMIAGALAAMAVVLCSGREDWWRRIAYFAFFGALGWSFGGMISYMQVIAYTHSGHLSSQIYGFACLFIIGFLWAAMGGAGTAAAASLDRKQLTELIGPIIAVFIAWFLQDVYMWRNMTDDGDFRHETWFYWYDTDWVAALLAIPAALVYAGLRRRICLGTSLVLHAAIGWWVGFLIFLGVNAATTHFLNFEFRMTPPRSDNWAGATGMTVGILVFCYRKGFGAALLAGLIAGFVGGFGFAFAQAIKLYGLSTGLKTNWHSVLEQSYGLINGIGIAIAMGVLASRTEPRTDDPPERRWTEPFCVGFIIIALTFINLVKNVETWTSERFHAMQEVMYGLHAYWWFAIGYGLALLAFVVLAIVHMRRPLAVIPERWLGKGPMLYLVFLWVMVIGNLMRAIPPFEQQRLITEGVIIANAILCTVLICLLSGKTRAAPQIGVSRFAKAITVTIVLGVIGLAASLAGEVKIARTLYGGEPAPGAGRHIRFGPDATAKGMPKPGQPHP